MAQKILIVEDDNALRNMYVFKLKTEGYDVEQAVDGDDGLKKAESHRPDLILLDLMMPNVPGEEMLEKLRGEDWGSDIKVIILTNISRDEAPKILQFLNVRRYIVKAHTTPSQVVDIVREVLA